MTEGEEPAVGAVVAVMRRDLRALIPIGETRTDVDGWYELALELVWPDRPIGRRVDLVVRAFAAGEPDRVGEASLSVRAASERDADHVVDLAVPVRPRSEWEQVTTAVPPLLAGQDGGAPLEPWDLDTADLDHLAAVTGLGREALRTWMVVALAARDEWVGPEQELVGRALYAVFRNGGTEPVDAVLQRTTPELIETVQRAAAEGVVPSLRHKDLRVLRGLLDAQRVEQAMRPAADGRPGTLGDTLRIVPGADALHLDDPDGPGRRVAALVLAAPPEAPPWGAIRGVVDNPDLFTGVRRGIGLRTLTGGHLPLMQALQGPAGEGDAATLTDLVALDEPDWLKLVRRYGAPPGDDPPGEPPFDDDQRQRAYARRLARAVERLHPVPFIALRLADDRIPVAPEAKQPLGAFLAANAGFRFRERPMLELLSSDDVDTGGIDADQLKVITPELLTLERVARLAPSLAQVGGLRADGYASARDVVLRHARDVFVEEIRPVIADEEEARRTYDAAAGVVAATEGLAMSRSPLFAGAGLPVLPLPQPFGGPVYGTYAANAAGAPIQPATVAQLFGSQDYSECGHGASLLGPAAYLADLLQMLARGQRTAGRTALQVLLARRPDIAELDLSGDNADMTLPYLDLVLEALETPEWETGFPVLRGGTRQAPNNDFDALLDAGQVPAALADDIETWALPLGADRTVVRGADVTNSNGVSFPSWLVRDQRSGMKLRLLGVKWGFYRIRAYPQSVSGMETGYRPWPRLLSATAKAVARARFPWSLPFDVTRDEANAWLAHLGASREQSMLAFLDGARWRDPDAACEALDLCPAPRDVLLTGPGASAPEHRDWGFPNPSVGPEGIVDPIAGLTGQFHPATSTVRWPGPAGVRTDSAVWHALLKNVSLLRARARLSHRELLAVLETRFVRAGGPRLPITGDEGDPALMRLESLDPALARRIHLFVRLWRRTGWSTVDLDRAIVADAGHTAGAAEGVRFTPGLLLFVANVARLNATTGVSVADLVDLYAGRTLDTFRYWDHAGRQPVLLPSRYEHWFDNPALGRPRLPEFRLDATGAALLPVPRPATGPPRPRLSDHRTYVAGAVGLSERDLATLLPTGVVSNSPAQVGAAPVSGDPVDLREARSVTVEIVVGAVDAGAAVSVTVEHAGADGVFSAAPAAEVGNANPMTVGQAGPTLTRVAYTGSGLLLRTRVSASGTSVWVTTRVLTDVGAVTDELSLGTLTGVYRYGVLRRLLRRPLDALRALARVSGVDALAAGVTPDRALDLLDARDTLDTLGLSPAGADDLLRGPAGPAAAALEGRVEGFLAAVRTAAAAVWDESTVAPDQRSVLLSTVMANTGWDQPLVARVLGAGSLGAAFDDYAVPLDAAPALPGGAVLPQPLRFDAGVGRLTAPATARPAGFRAVLAPLVAGVAAGPLRDALAALDDEANRRERVLAAAQADLRAASPPTHRVAVAVPAAFTFAAPPEWRGRLFHDRGTGELCLVGWLSPAEAAALAGLPGLPVTVVVAIGALGAASAAYVPSAAERLVVREGAVGLSVEQLLLDTAGTQDRSGLLLERLLPGWRRDRLGARVAGSLAEAVGSSPETAEALLALHDAGSGRELAALVTAEALLLSDAATRPVREALPDPFAAAARLIVLAELAAALRMTPLEVSWLAGPWAGLDLTIVPTTRLAAPVPGGWSALAALADLFVARRGLPTRAASLGEVLAATAGPDVDGARLARALGCDVPSLRAIGGAGGVGPIDATWVRRPSDLRRLVTCLGLATTLNVPAEVLVRARRAQLADRPVAEAEAELRALREASLADGAEAREGVLDRIRTRRRDATVDHLVQARGLRDADDLYGYLLIDPKMGPCTLTSRMVQAISAVQLFVQRSLLGLELEAPPKAIDRDHWTWMKNYRVWEANRQVLFHAENWIEPELREDRTPFFDELINSFRQGDATGNAAEIAVRRFVEQLTDFSRMEIVGLCSTYDDENRLLVTNVFGRTSSEPHAYFHRQFRRLDPADRESALGVWTPWQALSLDIEGDHLIPVVWRGRTFLFWATFTKEAAEPTAEELQQGQSSPGPPRKYWRFKLAWSEFKSGRWTARRIAQDGLSGQLDVGKQTQDRPYAEETSDWFYFQTAAGDEGVTIAAFWHNDWNGMYDPLAMLFFDGDRVVRADGTFVRQQTTYRFTQTAVQRANTPVDRVQSESEKKIYNHYRMSGSSGAGSPLALGAETASKLNVFATPPRDFRTTFPPTTPVSPFAAPPPDATVPIPAARRTIPFVFSDRLHTFFVYPVLRQTPTGEDRRLHFFALDWPQAGRMRQVLDRHGIDGLLSHRTQKPVTPPLDYFVAYGAPATVVGSAPDGDLEFARTSASSAYNEELFFHVPFAVACALHKNQRFEEARQWFHHVFDPTDASTDPSPARYWGFRPFRELQELPLPELLRRLADPADASREKLEFQSAIKEWQDQPFRPHALARLRPRSYMFAVVMKYLDNLLDWADQLFRRDTTESNNEAAQLYVLAAQILGRRPDGVPRRTRPVLKGFTELADAKPDDLTNALVDAENLIPAVSTGSGSPAPSHLRSLYFCLPHNERLDTYYDRVEDRLFKLRNCMNIDGVERQVALFAPRLDPALLVRAAAAGVDLGAVLSDANAPLPHYRFTVMAQKAVDLCQEVKGLGSTLLTVLEKGDAESLALMRMEHEGDLQHRVRILKHKQLLDAKASLDVLGANLTSANAKYTHYVGLLAQLAPLSVPTGPVAGPTLERLGAVALDVASGATELAHSLTSIVDPLSAVALDTVRKVLSRASEALSANVSAESIATAMVPMNPAEEGHLRELKSAHDLQEKAADQRLVAQFLAMIPDFTLGTQGFTSSPVVQFQIGGTLLSKVANFAASMTDGKASEHTYRASLHETLAGYQRRAADWTLQAQLACLEMAEIGEQIKAATLKVAIASQEFDNHDLQTAQSAAQLDLMRSKFTDGALYSWMSGRLAALYFDAYQLAYDIAKRAERCFVAELGVDVAFIKYGYWDSLRKGLLAADGLSADIKRMEAAYVGQNAREYEITKRVSLRTLDPRALVELRETGECEFTLPEVLYDLDFAGHYFRRVKTVSVSVPSVVGPYTGLSGTLTLLSSKVRVTSDPVRAGYADEENFRVSSRPAQAIATSTGQDDSGMFELSFRDDRYLPFEGAGAIGSWRFALPTTFRPFDYTTISDLVLQVRYTAREGGGRLRAAAQDALTEAANAFLSSHGDQGFARSVSLAQEFPDRWRRLVSDVDAEGVAAQTFPIARDRFPFLVGRRTITVGAVDLLGIPTEPGTPTAIDDLAVTLPGADDPVTVTDGEAVGRLRARSFVANLAVATDEADTGWTLTVPADAVADFRATVDDLVLLLHYAVGDDPDA
ncbi:neuraminidase-like domain-containing protein [Cellulomonas xiejunii]|uniref:Tc toxin subunit A-related protein n=1 Tax=Cellulomonas xiejunii TaxID=2968083 RepID=UPI001D0E67CE|nr:neuraminidase-like domain-containing protein [Cellulomonas xiejunii]